MSKVLVAGCGYVGQALGSRLAKERHEVWGLLRHPENLPDEIQPFKADLSKPETLQKLPSDLEYLFYMASADQYDDTSYKEAYVDGLKNLLDVLTHQKQKPKRIFFISSTSVYAQTGGEWVDENSPTEPTHFSGKRLLEGENIIQQSPLPATVVRFGAIYGPGRTRLIESLRKGEAVCPKEKVYTNRIHRDDCARILTHLMKLKRPADLYIGVDNDPADLTTVLWWLASYMKVPLPPDKEMPEIATGRRGSNKRCKNDRLVDSGYFFLYNTFREGYAAILEEEKNR